MSLSSCDLRSVKGTRGLADVVLRIDLEAVLVVVASFPATTVVLGDIRLDLFSLMDRFGDTGLRRGLVL